MTHRFQPWLLCFRGRPPVGRLLWLAILPFVAQAASTPQAFSTGDDTGLRLGVHEIVLSGNVAVENPFDLQVLVRFVPPSGGANARTVEAFFDGDGLWRARVYLTEVGEWTWTSECAINAALGGKHGTFQVEASALRGRLLPHPKNERQWMTENGRWFLNLNDTAYYLLCARDGAGDPVPEVDFQAYVRDAAAHGITSFRSWFYHGPRSANETDRTDRYRWRQLFADEAFSRVELSHQRLADQRLQWLLNHYPDLYVQLILFPLGVEWGRDSEFWAGLSQRQKDRILRYLIARYAAYPQVFWLMISDAHYAPDRFSLANDEVSGRQQLMRYTNNIAMAHEVGRYFQEHDPWRHPFSTGHARTLPFRFGREDWATYIQIEDLYDLGARAFVPHHRFGKPVFLGEDRYEQDRHSSDPKDMRYFQRRLFWAWLFSGGSASYGGRWWVVHPYTETGRRSAQSLWPNEPRRFTAALTGLDSVRFIRDYFQIRSIELSDYEPDSALVRDLDGAAELRAPKLTRRRHEDFLIYHPNAAADGREARVDATKQPGLSIDLTRVAGTFTVEWYRVTDGTPEAGPPMNGGQRVELRAPWRGEDCIVRLSRRSN